jgi:hypothetical protein
MGTDYGEVRNFRQKAVATLRKIQALYPAKLGPLRGGIRIEPDSLPTIAPRPTATVEHTRQAPPEWRLEEAEPSAEVAAVVNERNAPFQPGRALRVPVSPARAHRNGAQDQAADR